MTKEDNKIRSFQPKSHAILSFRSISAKGTHAEHDVNATCLGLGTLTEGNVSAYHRGMEVQREKESAEG